MLYFFPFYYDVCISSIKYLFELMCHQMVNHTPFHHMDIWHYMDQPVQAWKIRLVHFYILKILSNMKIGILNWRDFFFLNLY